MADGLNHADVEVKNHQVRENQELAVGQYVGGALYAIQRKQLIFVGLANCRIDAARLQRRTGFQRAVSFRVAAGMALLAHGGLEFPVLERAFKLAHRGKGRAVHKAGVIAVINVLGLELPVAFVAVFVRSGDAVIAARSAFEPQINVLPSAAEKFFQLLHLGVERAKDQPAVAGYAGQRFEVLVSLVKARGIARFIGDADQLTAGAKRPAVVRADKGAGVAGFFAANGGAAVGAGVEHGVHLAITPARDDDRARANLGRLEVTRVGDFAFIGQINPGAVEDAFQFLLEHGFTAISGSGNAKFLGLFIDQLGDGLGCKRGVHDRAPDPDIGVMRRC